jgi:hypothetical protein
MRRRCLRWLQIRRDAIFRRLVSFERRLSPHLSTATSWLVGGHLEQMVLLTKRTSARVEPSIIARQMDVPP